MSMVRTGRPAADQGLGDRLLLGGDEIARGMAGQIFGMGDLGEVGADARAGAGTAASRTTVMT